jgi:hypothetical protein
MEILAEVEIGEIGEVVPNDDARSSFTVVRGIPCSCWTRT